MNERTSRLNLLTATNFVIANMIGTGVFTSLGFQLNVFSNPVTILLLWLIGGILALFGAFAYAELGTLFPRSGGEYNFLRQIYHPSLGFLAGWTSITIGFAAPVGLACIAFGKYLYQIFPYLTPTWYALIILAIITLAHSRTINLSSGFQNGFTLFKIFFIVFFILAGLLFSPSNQDSTNPITLDNLFNDIFSAGFFVSLIYVSYAYSGWNASAYFVNDLKNPRSQLPRSLVLGTGFVMLLYLLLNYTFMQVAPLEKLKGEVEIGFIAAEYIFNPNISKLMALIISLLLISSISSMVFTGPRVLQVMGEDIFLFKKLAYKTQKGIPLYALLFQSLISAILILLTNFENLLTFTGFTLNIFTFLSVMGIFIVRYKKLKFPSAVRTIGHPLTTLFFMLFNAAMAVFLIVERPTESLAGLGLLLVGGLIYIIDQKISKS
ncbi:MAG: amino acid permease [Bacteroidales bacterium]|nr:amino acid permease [Bacteroidales bacterium]